MMGLPRGPEGWGAMVWETRCCLWLPLARLGLLGLLQEPQLDPWCGIVSDWGFSTFRS